MHDRVHRQVREELLHPVGIPPAGSFTLNLDDDLAPDWPSGKGSYRVVITGTPTMRCEFEFEDERGDHAVGGVLLTATRLVNAIPAVCRARPGLLSALDLPLVTGRGLRRQAAPGR